LEANSKCGSGLSGAFGRSGNVCSRNATVKLWLYTAASSRTVLTFLEANPEIKVDVIEKDFTKGELR
jgi:hypothetical protein